MKKLFSSLLVVLFLATASLAQRVEPVAGKGPVETQVEALAIERQSAKTDAERETKSREIYTVKAQALADEGKLESYETIRRGRTFEIEFKEAPSVDADGVLVVHARALESGEAVALGAKRVEWERLRFVNPPIKVPTGEVVDGVAVTVEDTGAALREIVAQAVGKIAKTGPPDVPGSVGNTSTTIYSEPESDALLNGSGTDRAWADAVAAAGSASPTATANWLVHWTARAGGDFDQLHRGVTSVPKAAIAGDIVTAATVSLYIYAKADANADAPVLHCTEFTGNATSIVDADYGVANFGASRASLTYAAVTTGAYNDFVLDATGIAYANASSGYIKFGWRSGHDIAVTAPNNPGSGEAGFGARYADQSGTSSDPNVLLEHQAPTVPELAALSSTGRTQYAIALAQPTFDVAGDPTPTVQAWIGLDGTISESEGEVSGALAGPVDVSAAGHEFAGLIPATWYRMIVVAENAGGTDAAELAVRTRSGVGGSIGTPF